MDGLHTLNDDHLLEAVAAELNAEVYQDAVSDGTEPSRLDLDVGQGNEITDNTDKSVPEPLGPTAQGNVEPDPS
jgi:hypothetical protein